MPSFGEKLKKEREKRKITLEEISSSTKIGTRMLQALEEDKFDHLPGGIFNKGFVRAYARCIGIDEDQTVADYLQASGDAPPPSTEIPSREGEERGDGGRARAEKDARLESISENPSRPLPWGLFAAILLLVALALSLWSRHTREEAKQTARMVAADGTRPASDLGSAAESTGATSEGTSGGTKAEPGPAAGDAARVSGGSAATGVVRAPDRTVVGTPVQTPTSSGAQHPAVSSSSVTSSSPSSNPPSAMASAPAAGEFSVVVQTREESWISMRADGKTVPSELLPAGSEREVRARKEVVVKIGNAGAVDLRFNGKKVDGGGDFGEVRLVTFGPNGLLPNAPAAPSNP